MHSSRGPDGDHRALSVWPGKRISLDKRHSPRRCREWIGEEVNLSEA